MQRASSTRGKIARYKIAAGLIGGAILQALCGAPAAAAEQPAITLDKAVEQALASNPEIRAAERQIDAARAREVQAAAWPNPNLSLDLDEVPVVDPLAGKFKAGFSQPLLVGGYFDARKDVARLDKAIAEIDLDVLRRDLAARVGEAYVQLLFAREDVKRSRLADEGAAAVLAASEARLKAGAAAPVEVLQARVERSRTEREVAAAELRLRAATGRLDVLLGRKAGEPLNASDLGPPGAIDLPPRERLVESGLRNRLELRRAALVIEREALGRRLAQAGIWTGTEIAATGGIGEGKAILGTSLTIPLPFYRQQGEIQEAEANRARAEAERAALEAEIALDVEQARGSAVVAGQQVALFQGTYVPQAEQLVDNAQRRFLAGEGTGIEVVEARRALREATLQQQQATLEYREALIKLERASGVHLLD